MQLVWSDILKTNPWVFDIIDVYFSAMQCSNIGKASTKFFEVATDLNHIVLTNKVYQSTRFVRALLRGLTAALRNLPTLHAVVYLDYQEAAISGNNTRGKELGQVMNELQSAQNLFFTIGLVQILEIYSDVSLEVQSASHFPIQVWTKIDTAKQKLADLGENWTFSTEQLKLSGIGTPKSIIDNILEAPTPTYTPFVPIGTIRKNKEKVNVDFEKLFEENRSKNINNIALFEEENQRILELAGKCFV